MRYYTVCEMTPSVEGGSGSKRFHGTRKNEYSRVFPAAPGGFLFHDTEAEISVHDIRHALHRLANLYEVGESDAPTRANQALAIQVDDNTVVASFSTAALPRPVRVRGPYDVERRGFFQAEWLGNNPLETWLIPRVNDLGTEAVRADVEGYYDACIRLERLTDCCPCELQRSGECFKTLVLPNLPEGMAPDGVPVDYSSLDFALLRRVKYKVLPGNWTLVSPKVTTTADFTATYRPWDYHDFRRVDDRQKIVSERAALRHNKDRFRKATCVDCAFSSKDRTGARVDCGRVTQCKAGSTEEMAWAVLMQWLHKDSGFMEMPGFTTAQRDHLIRLAGSIVKAKTFSTARNVENIYGGFYWNYNKVDGRTWQYQLAAAGGDLQRLKTYSTYAELQQVIPQLPDTPDNADPLPDKTLYAFAAFGSLVRIHAHGKPSYMRRVTKLSSPNYVETDGASQRYVSIHHSFALDSAVKNYVRIHPHIAYHDVSDLYARITGAKYRLPVVT